MSAQSSRVVDAAFETDDTGLPVSESEVEVAMFGDCAAKCFKPSLVPTSNALGTYGCD
jgi:hypothetical protein